MVKKIVIAAVVAFAVAVLLDIMSDDGSIASETGSDVSHEVEASAPAGRLPIGVCVVRREVGDWRFIKVTNKDAVRGYDLHFTYTYRDGSEIEEYTDTLSPAGELENRIPWMYGDCTCDIVVEGYQDVLEISVKCSDYNTRVIRL